LRKCGEVSSRGEFGFMVFGFEFGRARRGKKGSEGEVKKSLFEEEE